MKPSLLIDLSSAEVFPLDDSFFGRPNCFQIILASTELILCCDTREDLYAWMTALGLVAARSGLGPPVSSSRATQIKSLTVIIDEAKGLSAKTPEAYAIVSLNSIKFARTPAIVGKGSAVFWKESFQLE